MISLKNLRRFKFSLNVDSFSSLIAKDKIVFSSQVLCPTSEHIELLGNKLGKFLDIGDVLLLRGDLGAGKVN